MPTLNDDQFFHGTRSELSPGDLISPGRRSNYGRSGTGTKKHVYATRSETTARVSAVNAKPWKQMPRVYEVEHTGEYERDPEQHPDTPTERLDVRSTAPLRVIREVWNAPAHVQVIGGKVIG